MVWICSPYSMDTKALGIWGQSLTLTGTQSKGITGNLSTIIAQTCPDRGLA